MEHLLWRLVGFLRLEELICGRKWVLMLQISVYFYTIESSRPVFVIPGELLHDFLFFFDFVVEDWRQVGLDHYNEAEEAVGEPAYLASVAFKLLL